MKKLELYSRRFYRGIDPEDIQKELDDMEKIFKETGHYTTRSHIGTVILELEDRLIYYVPRGNWIEEIIIAKVEEEVI